MSGGIAYVYDTTGTFSRRCNPGMVDLESLDEAGDLELVKNLITRHLEYTGSQFAERVLSEWTDTVPLFVKVMPRDYKRVLKAQKLAEAEGRTPAFSELVGA